MTEKTMLPSLAALRGSSHLPLRPNADPLHRIRSPNVPSGVATEFKLGDGSIFRTHSSGAARVTETLGCIATACVGDDHADVHPEKIFGNLDRLREYLDDEYDAFDAAPASLAYYVFVEFEDLPRTTLKMFIMGYVATRYLEPKSAAYLLSTVRREYLRKLLQILRDHGLLGMTRDEIHRYLVHGAEHAEGELSAEVLAVRSQDAATELERLDDFLGDQDTYPSTAPR